MAKAMDQRFFVNTSSKALDIATIIAAKARPRNMPMPLPVSDHENSDRDIATTVFVYAFIDPAEIADTIDVGDLLFVSDDDDVTRRTEDDCVLPTLCSPHSETARPFGVVSRAGFVASVKDKAYIGVACQGPCLVLTSEIFSPNQSIAAGTPVTLGAVDGIPAKLLVYDNPYSQVLI